MLFAKNYKILYAYLSFRASKEAWGHSTKDSTYDGPCQHPDQASLPKEHFLRHFISISFAINYCLLA